MSEDSKFEKELSKKVARANGRGAFKRMRQAPRSHAERMENLYGGKGVNTKV